MYHPYKKIIITIFMLFTVNTAFSFGLSSLKDIAGSASKSVIKVETEVAESDVAAYQESLLRHYLRAAKYTAEGQQKFAGALGLKVLAAEAAARIKTLSGTSDNNAYKKDIKFSQSADKAIKKAMKSKKELPAESKQEFAKGMLPYMLGINALKETAKDVKPFLSSSVSIIKAASPSDALTLRNKFVTGTTVAKGAPKLFKAQLKTVGTLKNFAKSQQIKIPAKATKIMDDPNLGEDDFK